MTLATRIVRAHTAAVYARSTWSLAALLLVADAHAAPPQKTATLVSAEGKLAIGGGSASTGATIAPGSQVDAGDDAHALIDVGDARITVAPRTIFHVYGKPAPKGSKKLVVSDSTLSSGIVRASTTKPVAIDTPSGKIALAAATDAQIHVEKGVTRVSVHKGSAKAGGVAIGEGLGLRVGKGKPTKLPPAPTWTAAPKAAITTKGDAPADVTGVLGGAATRWHLEVAMDAAFTEYQTDTLLDAKSTTLVVEQKLPPGRWFVRVSAIDERGLEGPWSAVAETRVTSTKGAP